MVAVLAPLVYCRGVPLRVAPTCLLLLAALVAPACQHASGPDPEVDHLIRASMALRGIRPGVDDMEAVHLDPAAAPAIIEGWVEGDEFGAMIRDLHSADLLMRSESHTLPAVGPLAGLDEVVINQHVLEEPLKLVEWVVRTDQPYSAILSTDQVLADPLVAEVWGLDIPDDAPHPLGDDWALTEWGDDRPAAGILVSSALWFRRASNGVNYNRSRANSIARAEVCDDLLLGSVPLDDLGFSDEREVTDALRTNPDCTRCHDTLDPIASTLFGFGPLPSSDAIAVGCAARDPNAKLRWGCYPLRAWDAASVGHYVAAGQPEPAFFGTPVADLRELGAAITADPRFATCAARRFTAWFTHSTYLDYSESDVADLAEDFVDHGLSARRLAVQAVLGDAVRDAGPLAVRPEEYSRLLYDLTGYRWLEGSVDLLGSDTDGWRLLAGGIDNYYVTVPDSGGNAARALVISRAAERAAAFVVANDWEAPVEARRLLSDPADVDGQLSLLHLRILGEFDADVAPSRALFEGAGGGRHGWEVVIAAMLQDARVVWY